MTDRLARARAEIELRRKSAENALEGPWQVGRPGRSGVSVQSADDGAVIMRGHINVLDAEFIAANDPAHVLTVLAAADATLDRHGQFSAVGLAPGDWCPFDGYEYPCADLLAILDLYAPEPQP